VPWLKLPDSGFILLQIQRLLLAPVLFNFAPDVLFDEPARRSYKNQLVADQGPVSLSRL
jgi:hypothetical protein